MVMLCEAHNYGLGLSNKLRFLDSLTQLPHAEHVEILHDQCL